MKGKILIIFSLIWYHLTNWLPLAEANANLVVDEFAPERRAVNFVVGKLSDKNGLILSAVEFGQPTKFSLSESMGQVMLYAAQTGDAMLWDLYCPALEKHFWQDGFYAWRVDLSALTADNTSALIDDLRIAQAYLRQEKRNPGNYREKIITISDGLLQNSVDAEYNISDFFIVDVGAADHVSLFYLDTATMDDLADYDTRWRQVKKTSTNILASMPDNELGFFPQAYFFNAHDYRWGNDVSMVENLYTAMFAHNTGRDTSAFADFLRGELDKGKICNRYFLDGQPSFSHDSVAVYALAARYFHRLGDSIHAKTAYDKMMGFFMKRGKLSGGFGYYMLGTVYAFDQLEALLTMAELPE